MARLSKKTILLLSATVVGATGVAVAVPTVFAALTDKAAVSESDALNAIQVSYNEELPTPASPDGYKEAVLRTTGYKKGVAVGTRPLYADFYFPPADGSGKEGFTVRYTVVVNKAYINPPVFPAKRDSYILNSGSLPQLAEAELPALDGEKYDKWAFTTWRLASGRQADASQIAVLPISSRFSALYTANLKSANYAGNSASYVVEYTVVQKAVEPLIATAPKATDSAAQKNRYNVVYGTSVLPVASDLPALPEGYKDGWDVANAEYRDTANNNLINGEYLAKMPAGATFTAVYTARIDTTRYAGSDSRFTATYTIVKKTVTVPTSRTEQDTHTVKEGDQSLPGAPGDIPAVPEGFTNWSRAQYFKDLSGTVELTLADFRALRAGDVFIAVYSAIKNPNYDVADYTFTVQYTVGPGAANNG